MYLQKLNRVYITVRIQLIEKMTRNSDFMGDPEVSTKPRPVLDPTYVYII